MTATLPSRKLHPRSLPYGNTRVGGAVTRPAPPAPWLDQSCEECGWDGDAAIVVDADEGLMGFECPDCYTFVVTRDLVPDEREDTF